MDTTIEKVARPFHQSIVKAIRRSTTVSVEAATVVGRLICDTEIVAGHDQIITELDRSLENYSRDARQNWSFVWENAKAHVLAEKDRVRREHSRPICGACESPLI